MSSVFLAVSLLALLLLLGSPLYFRRLGKYRWGVLGSLIALVPASLLFFGLALADHEARELGFENLVDRLAAKRAGVTDASVWRAVGARFWSVNRPKAAEAEAAQLRRSQAADREARELGFKNLADRHAAEQAGVTDASVWRALRRDQAEAAKAAEVDHEARELGFESLADRHAAEQAGVTDASAWRALKDPPKAAEAEAPQLRRSQAKEAAAEPPSNASPMAPVVLRLGFAWTLSIEKPFRFIAIGDPKIVDVVPSSTTTVTLHAVANGATNILFLDERNEIVTTVDVFVVIPPTSASAPPAAKVEPTVNSGTGNPGSPMAPVVLRLGFAWTLSIEKPFRFIAIGDPKIVDVIPSSTTTVTLHALANGATNILFLDERNEIVTTVDVFVGIPPTSASSPQVAKVEAPTVNSGTGNPEHDRLSHLPEAEQASLLGQAVPCRGTYAFFMGMGPEKVAFWSVRCADGKSYGVGLAPNAADSKVLECSIMNALPGVVPCFKKFSEQSLSPVTRMEEKIPPQQQQAIDAPLPSAQPPRRQPKAVKPVIDPDRKRGLY
jgi:hypothetical protein